MPDIIHLNPGDEASPGGETLCPVRSGSGKRGDQKHHLSNSAGMVIDGIGGKCAFPRGSSCAKEF